MAWLTQPVTGVGRIGVVLIPPLGYESFTTHRTVRVLAERLAANGCSVVRFDLDGTGDSWGNAWDPDRVLAWRASLHEAAAFLTAIGCRSLVLGGVRFGATLAITEGADMGADRVLAWAPVIKGRTFVRELTLLGDEIPDDPAHPGLAGGVVQAGTCVRPPDPRTPPHLRPHRAHRSAGPPGARHRPGRPGAQRRARRAGSSHWPPRSTTSCWPDRMPRSTGRRSMPRSPRPSSTPSSPGSDPSGPSPSPTPPTDVAPSRWSHDGITEQTVRLGRHRLVGVLTEPD